MNQTKPNKPDLQACDERFYETIEKYIEPFKDCGITRKDCRIIGDTLSFYAVIPFTTMIEMQKFLNENRTIATPEGIARDEKKDVYVLCAYVHFNIKEEMTRHVQDMKDTLEKSQKV